MRRGSITVFSSLCMMAVICVLFFLLEAARVCGLEQYAKWKCTQGIECAAAEYQPYLWKEFRLLVLDGGYATETFAVEKLTARVEEMINTDGKKNVERQRASGLDFFQMKLSHIYEPNYLLLTDEEGAVFFDLVAAYMKDNLSREMAEEIYKNYEKQKEMQQETPNVETAMETAEENLEMAKKEIEQQRQQEDGQEEEEVQLPQIEENPLEIVKEVKELLQFNRLAFVIADPQNISAKKMNLEESVENRVLEKGNMAYASETDWYEKILAIEYASSKFSYYGNEKETHSYAYELEYLVGGKEEERENLETVVDRLLLCRTAANITYLLSDREKMTYAQSIALTLAGFTQNAVIIKGVEVAVVAAWAFLESIQDLRTLLTGGKIALMKDAGQWTTDVFHLSESFQTSSKAKECENGFSYEQYVKQLLFFVEDSQLAYRMLNVMEQNLRQTDTYVHCRMDYMMVCFDYEMQLLATPLFSQLSFLGISQNKEYHFEEQKKFSYIP